MTAFANAQPTQTLDPLLGNVNLCNIVGAAGIPLDECPANANNFRSDFRNGVYNRGNDDNRLAPGAIWRFSNVGTIGSTTINAEIKVNGMLNAVLQNSGTGNNTSANARIEDDDAQDQNNASIAGFFAPRIAPSANLTTADKQGYVDFTITFFNGSAGNGFTTPFFINNLNYVHYDIDGGFKANALINAAWFRETGVAMQDESVGNKFSLIAAASSELGVYSYLDEGKQWAGFAGTVFERTGVSRCAQTAVSYRYTAGRSSVRFRMGYSYKAGPGFSWSAGARQYGATFGCYAFPNAITLPVKLTSFSGTYKNNIATLNWDTENEENFSHFEIERSKDGISFETVGTKEALVNQQSKKAYQYADDLSAVAGTVFYYRLKMIDQDAHYKYSNVISLRKDSKSIKGVTLNPSPVTGNTATVRFTASAAGLVSIRVVDMAGINVLQQQSKVYNGNNSITVSDLQSLNTGIYILQVFNGEEKEVIKFTVSR